jgi:hypothetical protein
MDSERFDALSRRVAARTDRRKMLRATAAGTLAMLGLGAVGRSASAADGREGSSCFANDDCETGLICEGVTTPFIATLIGEGFGPSSAAALFPTRAGTCRYRGGDNCAKSGQFCRNDGDCCNGLNLVCRNDKCQR